MRRALRNALKKADTHAESGSAPSGSEGENVEHARNADDMITAEFGFQRNGGTPGKTKPLIGFELIGAPKQPLQARVLYGANLSALGTLFRNR